ncbi:MAG: aspartate aminotransferase family protein [Frankiales bacterium]|nr:aspartate aminotransferase family protein [Frankiales bacterium]
MVFAHDGRPDDRATAPSTTVRPGPNAAAAMFSPTVADRQVLREIASWVADRLAYRDDTMPPRRRAPQLPVPQEHGIGVQAAWAALRDQVLPTAVPADHPRYLAFVPGAPSVAAVLADLAVSASGIYAGSELEGGAAVEAERSALRWLSDLIGLPAQAHGAFVSGGSMANLSALVAARHLRRRLAGHRPHLIVAGAGAHSSIISAAEIMGCDVASDADQHGRLDALALRRILRTVDPGDIVAVAATAGATNDGAIDALGELADVCAEHEIWLHVDAAYGGGALLSDRTRPQFAGIERANSVTIDPHKWLFTPFDCAAVLYRDPEVARAAHTQTASYLEPVGAGDNPSDYAIHLTRRARGLPLWLSLLANGTAGYRDAVDRCLDLAADAGRLITRADHLQLVVDPQLSVVLFRRLGWRAADYARWSQHAISSGLALVTPTKVVGETVLRLCFVNPLTTRTDIERIIADLS